MNLKERKKEECYKSGLEGRNLYIKKILHLNNYFYFQFIYLFFVQKVDEKMKKTQTNEQFQNLFINLININYQLTK